MRLKFDDYILDVVRRELWRGSARIAIEPQVFDLLTHLVQNPDRVVSRDELLQAIWDGRAISDSAIANRINGARRAIGDSGGAQRLIRTVPRRGFRFIGRVNEAPVKTRDIRAGRWGWRAVVTAAALTAVVALIVVWPRVQLTSRIETAMAPSILVSTLPLKVSGAGANDLGLSAINAVGDGLRYDPPRSAANPTPAHKPNEGVAAAALPRMSALPMVVAEEPKIPLAAVAAAAPMLIEQGTPSAPSSGKTWVEEAKWSIIPCAAARIDLGPGAKCQTGPPAMRGGHCDIARQAAMITNTRYQIEAEVAIFDPYKVTAVGPQGKECAVWAGQPNTPDYFKNLNQVTQRGGGWTNLIKGGSQNTASFTEHGRNCLAVQRLGPPWHGGYVWVVYASICSAAGSIQPTEIDDALVTLRLRTYDAQANLRVQSD